MLIRMLIRNIALVLLIFLSLNTMRFKKDDIPEQTIQKSAVWFVLFLGIKKKIIYVIKIENGSKH